MKPIPASLSSQYSNVIGLTARNILLCCIFCLTVQSGQATLLENSAFDGPYVEVTASEHISGKIAHQWRDNSSWTKSKIKYSEDKESPREGDSCQKVEVFEVNGGSPNLEQSFEPFIGETYEASVWIRGEGGEVMPVNLLIRDAADPYKMRGRKQVLATSEWQQIVVEWTSDSGSKVNIILNPEKEGIFYFDDAQLLKLEDSTAVNSEGSDEIVAAQSGDGQEILLNGDFNGPFHSPGDTRDGSITGEIANGWEDNSAWADVSILYGKDDLNPYPGNTTAQAITVQSVRSGAVQFVQGFEQRKGRTYRGAIWVRAEVSMPLQVLVRDAKGPWEGHFSQNVTLDTNWRRIPIEWTASKDFPVYLLLAPQASGMMFVGKAELADVTGLARKVNDAPLKTGNLLPNASFEVGLAGGWNGVVVTPPTERTNFLGDQSVSSDYAQHGERSLVFTARGGYPADINTPPVPVNWGRPHSFSVWIKADKPISMVQLRLQDSETSSLSSSTNVSVGTEWKKVSVTREPTEGIRTFRGSVRILANSDTKVWIDAAQMEEAPQTSLDFATASDIEANIAYRQPGGVFLADEPVILHFSQSGLQGRSAWVSVTVDDLYGKSEKLPLIPLPTSTITIPRSVENPFGVFRVTAAVVDESGNTLSEPVTTNFARLPAPAEVDPKKSFFGIHVSLTPEGFAVAKNTGNRWIRDHDSAPTFSKWAIAEPRRGEFQFFDKLVDAARGEGLEILGMLDGAPHWAASADQARREGYFTKWYLPDGPTAIQDWSNYVSRVVSHYKGRVDTWEVWNEPWVDMFFPNGTPELYSELLTAAYYSAKLANPAALIVGVSTADTKDEFTEAVLGQVGTESFDAFSFHAYIASAANGADNWASTQSDKFRQMQNAVGTAKPLWFTEGGPGPLWPSFFGETPAGAMWPTMSWIVRADVALMANGVEKFFVYSAAARHPAGSTGHQMLDHVGVIKPALAARANLASLIDGSTALANAKPSNGIQTHRFQRSDGRIVSVLWSIDGIVHQHPFPVNHSALDLLGNPIPAGASVAVGQYPIYLISND
jgi:hypothetical protein